MEVDRNGLEVLPRDECLRLLATVAVGRVGVTSGALPTILPVNFVVTGDQVVIRTAPGTKLDAAVRDTVVAFEADEIDPSAHGGWSVIVTGVARELLPEHTAALDLADLDRWAPGGTTRLVGISLDLVSGRRLVGDATVSGPG